MSLKLIFKCQLEEILAKPFACAMLVLICAIDILSFVLTSPPQQKKVSTDSYAKFFKVIKIHDLVV